MSMRGIDLSQNNTNVNYKVLARLGYEFAILRDGLGWGKPAVKDTMLNAHYKGVTAAGMQVGYYHYIYSKDAAGARQEAKETIEHIKGKRCDLFVACDIEESFHVKLPDKTLTEMVLAFANTIRAAGYTPAVYSMASLLNRLQWERIPDDVIVWAAHWGVDKPGVNHRVDCWQNEVVGTGKGATVRGTIPGAGGDIDLNVLYAEEADSGEAVWKDRYNRLAEQITQLAESCIVGGK